MGDQHMVARVREGMEALSRQDYEAFSELIADDVVWHVIGSSEPIRGKAAMIAGLGGGGGEFSITAEVHDITASDDHVVALVKAHARRGDRVLDYDTAEIFHVRDGQITERWAFSDDTARIAEFFA